MSMKNLFKSVLATGFIAAAASASAVPVAYTFTGTVSGTFTGSTGPTTFSNQLLTVRITGNTVNVTNFLGVANIDTGANTLTLGSLLNTSITQPGLYVFNNRNTSIVGFGVTFAGDLFSLDGIAALATYGLVTNLGPVADATPSVRQFIGVQLANGSALSLTAASNATFTAAVVPEPATVALLALGLCAVGAAVRRRA